MSRKKFEFLIVCGFILLYSLAATLVSLHRFWQIDAFWYDFGILDETVWRWSRFQLPVIPNLNPPLGKIVWTDHFNPTLILLTPVYWITDRPEAILIAQVVSAALSGFVAYLIARKVVKSSIVRIALVISYFGFVGLQNALYTDVHNIVFALLPFMLTVWAYYNRKWRWYWIFLLLTLGVQENMALVGVGLGIFIVLRSLSSRPRDSNRGRDISQQPLVKDAILVKSQSWFVRYSSPILQLKKGFGMTKEINVGITTIVTSILWGVLVMRVLIPFLNGGNYSYQPSVPQSIDGWLTGLILPADLKLRTIVLTAFTFGILPFFSLAALPLILFHFLERFVLNTAATRWDLGMHYNALLSPILFLGAIDVIERLQKKKMVNRLLPFWAVGVIGMVVFLHRFYLHGPLMLATHSVFYEQTRRNQFLRDFVAKIPRRGLIMTQNHLAAQLTHNRVVLLRPDFEKLKPDIIALDMRYEQNANDYFPLSPRQFAEFVASVSASPNYQKEVIREDQLLFERKLLIISLAQLYRW